MVRPKSVNGLAEKGSRAIMATNARRQIVRYVAGGDDVVRSLRASADYDYFKRYILDGKTRNETEARTIIKENIGRLTREDLKDVIKLVDYRYYNDAPPRDKHLRPHRGGRWFYRLLGPMNTRKLLEDEDEQKINQWFDLLVNDKYSASHKIDTLRREPYKISGIAHGFITLMLYLLNKAQYTVWFEELHKGLRRVCDLEEFKSKTLMGGQYEIFNDAAKDFAIKKGFHHTELDWVLSELAKGSSGDQ